MRFLARIYAWWDRLVCRLMSAAGLLKAAETTADAPPDSDDDQGPRLVWTEHGWRLEL